MANNDSLPCLRKIQDKPALPVAIMCNIADVVAYNKCWKALADGETRCPNHIVGFTLVPDSICSLEGQANPAFFRFDETLIYNIEFLTESSGTTKTLTELISVDLGGSVIELATLFGIVAISGSPESGTFAATVNNIEVELTVTGDGVWDNDGDIGIAGETTLRFDFNVPLSDLEFHFTNVVTPVVTVSEFKTYYGYPPQYHQVVMTNGTSIWFDNYGNIIDYLPLDIVPCDFTV